MTPARPTDGALVVVHAGDRAWRAAVDVALREAGARTRLSSRPAELAKSLADGMARVIVTGAEAADQAAVRSLAPSCCVISTTPGDTIAAIVRRALEARDAATPRQITSSE